MLGSAADRRSFRLITPRRRADGLLTPRVVRDPEQAAQLTELQKKQINVVLPPPPGSLPETPGRSAPARRRRATESSPPGRQRPS